MHFGDRIYELRKKQHLTQIELAARSGIAPAFLGQLERGLKSPTLRTVEKLAHAMNVSMDMFFNYPVPSDASKERAIADIQSQLRKMNEEDIQVVLTLVKSLYKNTGNILVK